jgi:hypothetical protein
MITDRWAAHRKDRTYDTSAWVDKKRQKGRETGRFLIPLFLWRDARRVRRRRNLIAVLGRVLSVDGGESATICDCSVILTTAGESFYFS